MKPSIPEGVRDFGPEQVARRNYIFDTIRNVFIRYGYRPIETPTFEKLSTLTGKYGEEGDKLLFKILNNGDFLAKADQQALTDRNSSKLISSICDRGLRYDLTVPFARFVVMRQHELSFPFKRFQIQPVWRADRPQRGRYREFYQCDADVVGSASLTYEAELVQIYDAVFSQLDIPVVIKISNRKVLEGIAEVAGCADKFADMTMAIDKLDKIGIAGVQKELDNRGISPDSIRIIENILEKTTLSEIKTLLAASAAGTKGVEELEAVMRYLAVAELSNDVKFDITLARGLNYYTGCILEVAAKEVQMGSIGGGGRYDNLTGVFGLPGMSGVGISFGADRIYDVLEELGRFPKSSKEQLKVLVVAFDDATHFFAFDCLTKLRRAGVNADLYPEPVKLQKQMKYANGIGVPYVLLIGEEEMASGQLTLKNMTTGEQFKGTLEEVTALMY